jgi:hypothetical protein
VFHNCRAFNEGPAGADICYLADQLQSRWTEVFERSVREHAALALEYEADLKVGSGLAWSTRPT